MCLNIHAHFEFINRMGQDFDKHRPVLFHIATGRIASEKTLKGWLFAICYGRLSARRWGGGGALCGNLSKET